MPLGNPEAYMDQGMPPEDAMLAASGAGAPMMQPPAMDEDAMMMMLLETVVGGIKEQELMADMKRQVLMQTLMELAMPAPQMGPGDFAEGGMTAPMGPPMPAGPEMGGPIA